MQIKAYFCEKHFKIIKFAVFLALPFIFPALFFVEAQIGERAIEPKSGIWKADGNAQLLVIENEKYQFYDFTSISCIASRSGESKDLIGKFFPKVDVWTEERFIVSYYDGLSTFQRLKNLPEHCRVNRDNTDPFYNFDSFWQYFQENYPSFGLRGINWEQMREIYRARIKEGMSEKELYAVLGEMVEKINDPHVFLSNRKQGAENISYGSPDLHGLAAVVQTAIPQKTTSQHLSATGKIKEAIETEIRYELLQGNFQTAHNDRLIWGMLTPETGYIRISQSVGLFPSGVTREQMYAQLDSTLDRVFTDLKSSQALILDVTTNTGGAHFITDFVARRVIQEPIVAYRSKVKTLRGFDEIFTQRLEPVKGPNFRGPVVVLISSNTVSGGEGLPLVLRGLPDVTLFGETTLGATGSFTMLSLPNGGMVTVANDVFTDRNDVWYEKRGIPPDVRVTVFNPEKLVTGYVEFVNKAVEFSKSKIKKGKPISK